MTTTTKMTEYNKSADDDEEDDDLGIRPGATVESAKNKYEIIEMVGEGGFGAVYKVYESKDHSKVYAMKVEKTVEARKNSKLKMEVMILKMKPGSDRKKSHFTGIVDRGKKENFTFIVMQLVGKSLAALKQERPEKALSMATGLSCSQQCLEACQDLHKLGFIHRDLKPANYAIGLDDVRLIYILDFGIARRIINDKGELKAPRAATKFKGTVKFASYGCHKGLELGPKDDCESWFYQMVDIMCSEGLPWRKMKDKNEVLRKKEDARSKPEMLIGSLKCKAELGKIFDYVIRQTYADKIDYDYIYKRLNDAATNHGCSLNDPYDWEKK